MRAALTALTDELKRLKSTGVTAVSVSAESIAALRKAVGARAAVTPVNAPLPSKVEAVVPASVRPPAPAPKPAAVASTLPPPPTFTLPAGDKATRWEWLRNHVVTHPVCVANVRAGKKVVLGVGSLDAKIMFVGEAPGADEEVQGEPFVGPAGQLLTKMIGAMGLKREEVYIGNIMNWRPQLPTPEGSEQTGNREPTPEEMAFCLPFLRAQIEIVKPALIVALGATAARGLLGAASFKTLGEVRGQWKLFSETPVTVTYHPSYLLRQAATGPLAERKSKRAVWEDLLAVMERAGLPISDKQRGYYSAK
ncbi:MAG: uracil-DNA glycosylase [Opitutaceae bacterium]|nr:uracil-DNA glycosylase [Opitutaceae bacterium]